MNVGIYFCQVLVRTYCKPLPTSSVALDAISKFSQKVVSGFWKKTSLYFTSPMKIFKPKCNRKSSQNPFNFYSIKNSFWCIKLVALRYYFQIVTKSYRVVFEKKDHFTSPPIWKFSSPNVKAKKKKKKKNPFNFDSIQNSIWVHKVTGIRMIFTRFHKKLLSSFWEKFTLLHLTYENC